MFNALEKGINKAFCADIFSIDREKIDSPDGVDTILMLMNGIGVVGDLTNLEKFFDLAKILLKPDGILVFDSVDFREALSGSDIASREADEDRDYFGVVKYRFNYKGSTGPEFSWLYIDPDRLEEIAITCGWKIDTMYPSENGHYLVQMSSS